MFKELFTEGTDFSATKEYAKYKDILSKIISPKNKQLMSDNFSEKEFTKLRTAVGITNTLRSLKLLPKFFKGTLTLDDISLVAGNHRTLLKRELPKLIQPEVINLFSKTSKILKKQNV